MHSTERQGRKRTAWEGVRGTVLVLVLLACLVMQLVSLATPARAEGEPKDARTYVEESLDEQIVNVSPEAKAEEASPLGWLRALLPEGDAQGALVDTGHTMRVKYTLVSSEVPKTLTIDELWDNDSYGANVFIAQYSGLMPLYDVGDEAHYVALCDATQLNGACGGVLDAAFARNNDFGQAVEGVVFDKETGIAYIPKALFVSEDGTEMADPIQCQLLMTQALREAPSTQLRVTVESRRLRVKPAATEQVITINSYDNVVSIPIVEAACASRIDLSDLTVHADGFDLPLHLTDENASYDQETGELSLVVSPMGLTGLHVTIGEGIVDSVAKSITLPAPAYAVSASAMHFYPHGELTLFKELESAYKANKVITYAGMSYSTSFSSKHDLLSSLRDTTNNDQDVYYYPGTFDATTTAKDLSEAEGVFEHTDSQWYWRCIGLPGDKNSHGYSVGTAEQWEGLLGANGSKTTVILPVACAHITRNVIDATETEDTIKMRVLDINTSSNEPYVIIAFCTSSTLNDGNASQVGTGIVKFHLKVQGELRLTKTSRIPAITKGNACYSLAGATFEVRDSNGKKVGSFTTDKDGVSTKALELAPGNYTVTETAAPTGYALDTSTYKVKVLAGEESVVETSDAPLYDKPSLLVEKQDAETGKAAAQGDATLAGAQFTLSYWDNTKGSTSGSPTRSWVLKSDASGRVYLDEAHLVSGDELYRDSSGAVALPLGTVSVRETKAPEGYLLPEAAATTQVISASDGALASRYVVASQPEQVVRGGVAVGKTSFELGDYLPQGEATLEGVTFSITLRSDKPVVVDGKSYAKGQVVATITTAEEDGAYVARTGARDLPYGTYEVRETTVPKATGYLINKEWSRTFEVRKDGITCDLAGLGDACPNQVQREDLAFTKKYDETGSAMAYVPFLLTSETTGEAHVIVTDENGLFDTTLSEHSWQTNANDAALADDGTLSEELLDPYAGVWFSGRANAEASPNDALGALPYDTYLLQELPCAANEGLTLVEVSVGMHRNAYRLDWGTIDDQAGAQIHTTLTSANGAHETPAAGKVTLTDTVSHEGLVPGKTYTLAATLHARGEDGSDAGVLVDGEDKAICAAITFTPKAASGAVDVPLELDADGLGSMTLVCFEELFEAESAEGEPVATHCDIADDDQSVTFVELGTTATDTASGSHEALAAEQTTIVDVVSYRGLTPGEHYTLTGTLHMRQADGSDGGVATQPDGGAITASVEVVPETSDGTVELAFEFDATACAGSSLVAFEQLRDSSGALVGSHEDLSDEGQTVRLPEVATSAADEQTQARTAPRKGTRTVVDVVSYAGLTPGEEYVVSGELHQRAADGSDAGALCDAEGNAVAASLAFVPESAEGSVELSFSFDSSLLEATQVVAFETLSHGERTVAIHADISDAKQTVTYPKVATTLTGAQTATHLSPASKQAVLLDEVAYEGLEVGRTYTCAGTLHLRDSEGADAGTFKVAGKDVTTSISFVPEEQSGSIILAFETDTSAIAGQAVVAFERIFTTEGEGDEARDIVVATHEDISSESQTVRVTSLATTLKDKADGDHKIAASGKVTVVDTVEYQGLVPGNTYTVVGTIHRKAADGTDAGALSLADGTPVTVTKELKAEASSGTVKLSFSFDAALLGGNPAVAFETLYEGDAAVASHADITDASQTVTPATDKVVRKKTPTTKTPANKTTPSKTERMPQTGRGPWAIALVAAGALLVFVAAVILVRRHRKKREALLLHPQRRRRHYTV